MVLIDAHTHLDSPVFAADRAEVVARARAVGVRGFLVCGTDPDAWAVTSQVAAEVGGVAALGIHPWVLAAESADAAIIEGWLEALAAAPLAALGELGLDHAKVHGAARERGKALFRAQLGIARSRDVPIVVHCVRAHDALFGILRRDGVPKAGGMVHAWSGAPVHVDQAVALGLHVSFGTLVTRLDAKKARESVARTPSHRLLLETDCPSQPLAGHTRGEPAHLVDVCRVVATLRGEDPEQVASTTTTNAEALFGPLTAGAPCD